MTAAGHWDRHAAQWSLVGQPLRPGPDDIRLFKHLARTLGGPDDGLGHLLLGVTPEIVAMRWPDHARLIAVDRSPVMIAALWRRPSAPKSAWAVQGDWATLPLPSGSMRLVLADGALNMCEGRAGWHSVAQELARVLKPSGHGIMRIFVRPEEAEPCEAVFRDLHAGKVPNPHIFKWRLAMALHGDMEQGVRLADVWDACSSAIADPGDLAARLGWSEAELRTIDVYRDVATRYTFPKESELADLLRPGFRILHTHRLSYALGERCPVLVLEAT
jgi:SAM-dependent methyltransferase